MYYRLFILQDPYLIISLLSPSEERTESSNGHTLHDTLLTGRESVWFQPFVTGSQKTGEGSVPPKSEAFLRALSELELLHTATAEN